MCSNQPNRIIIIVLVLACLGLTVQAQTNSQKNGYSCSGDVSDAEGTPLPGASVNLLDPDGKPVQGTNANAEGFFQINGIPAGSYQLEVTYLGYLSRLIPVHFKAQNDRVFHIVLEENNGLLEGVSVSGKSVNRELAERPVLTQVVNTKAVSAKPTTLVELLNRSAGIRVRQTGGLGAPSNLMLNGFQNRSIRYFKDGIPLDYLGGGFDISLVPVNMLRRVEVYKGVLPPDLGSDALGGALNMVTDESSGKHLSVSYETGSFNTHRASLNLTQPGADGRYFAGAGAFYNFSDNDYKVDAKVIDPETGTQYDRRVSLFHNGFSNYYAELFGGIRHTGWADELRIGLTGFGIKREVNYGSTMSQAIGAAVSRQHALVPTLRYRKAFLKERLKLDQFMAWSNLHSRQVDTAAGQYNWLGDFTPSDSRRGELVTRGSLAKLNYRYYTSRSHLNYQLTHRHQLDLNIVFSGFSRSGSDSLGQRFVATNEDVLSAKAVYDKQVYGLGVTSEWIKNKLNSQLSVKHYRYTTHATDADYSGRAISHDHENNAWGFAAALKWDLRPGTYFRLSGESALRLPEQDELFGNGDRKLSNFGLKPERSLNANLGFRTIIRDRYTVEVNSFYRITQDMILLLPYNFLFTQSQNIDNVKGIGLETDVSARLLPWLEAGGNFTYQDQRLYDTGNPSMELSRLTNTPYFFANLSLNGSFQDVFEPEDRLSVYWHYLFVRQYYLDALPKDKEPDGFLGLWGDAQIDARNVIPDQHVQDLGLTYSMAKYPLSIGLQVKNLFNKAVYDNFRIQNAGRAIFVKLHWDLDYSKKDHKVF